MKMHNTFKVGELQSKTWYPYMATGDDAPAANCSNEYLPLAREYFAHANALMISAIVVGGLATLIIDAVYIKTLRYVSRHTPRLLNGYIMFVISIYPVSSGIAFLSLLIPKIFGLVYLVIQATTMVCMYQLCAMVLCYFDAQEELSSRMVVSTLKPGTGPCCCCCKSCCNPIPVTRGSVACIRFMVLQQLLVFWVIFIIGVIMEEELGGLSDNTLTILQLVFVASVLVAAWGATMVSDTLQQAPHQLQLKAKFTALQLHLILHVLQTLASDYVIDVLPCTAPLSPRLWANVLLSTLLLVELVPLTLWSHRLYCRETPEVVTLRYRPHQRESPVTIPSERLDVERGSVAVVFTRQPSALRDLRDVGVQVEGADLYNTT